MLDGKIDPKIGVHLVGHSFGGVVALAATMAKIVPVKKLTLFETVDVSVLEVFGMDAAMNKVNEFVVQFKEAYNNDEDYACARVIDFWGGQGSFEAIPQYIQQQMITMTQNNIRHWELIKNNAKPQAAYQSLNIPVNLVYGSKSNMVAKTISKTLHQHFPNSSLFEINGASHFMITTHTDECVEIIKE